MVGVDAQRVWTPQAVHDEFRRLGRPTSRDSVQTFLQRAVGTDVRRIGKGVYRLTIEQPSITMVNGHGSAELASPETPSENGTEEPWLTPEILQRSAEEAQASFLANHPGQADPARLIEEAKRRMAGWIERHQPYDEAHVKRLMKTARDDLHRKARRNGSSPDRDLEADEVTPRRNYLGLVQLACALLWYRRLHRIHHARVG